ncbi:PEGA domain-containing protein [Sorangium sp. So ce1078]|uniref:PEGA domain-containing protein n=1 Tax=Sorangium sp. So ce1078 TaxID=3133329 RepID=UPI003F61D534
MKTRACAPVLLLSFIAPAVLTEAGLTSPLLSEPLSFAQSSDPVTEVARQRYEEGVKAYDAGRFEDARTAFLQVYALKRHPAVLLNLGQSELRSNHLEDAGKHLQQFLREHTTATPEQRAAAEKAIADVKRRTGFLVVTTDANGADISVDGVLVGKAPLLDPVFVPPGKHTLFATYQDRSATVQVDAKIGTATSATLTLGTTGAPLTPAVGASTTAPSSASPAAVTPPPAQPPAAGTAQPAPGATTPGATTPGATTPGATTPGATTPGATTPGATTPGATTPGATTPGATTPGATAPSTSPAAPTSSGGLSFSTSNTMGSMSPDQASGGREPFFHWYARKPLAWAGTGIAGVGLVLGIVGSAVAVNASSNADDVGREIEAYVASHESTIPANRRSQPCGAREDSSGDLPGFETACGSLRDELDSYDGALPLAITGWVLLGVGVVGTATYAMIDWYPQKHQAASDGPRVTVIAPFVAPGQVALGVAGTF